MKDILLTRHSETEQKESSLYHIFSTIEDITSESYNIVKVAGNPWSKYEQEAWILENALDVDMLLTTIPAFVQEMKTNGWKGKTIFKALGGFPRGGQAIREVLPYLYQSDVIWCTCTSDLEIYSLLVSQDGTQPQGVLLPYSVNTNVYTPLENREKKESLRREWGFGADDFVIVYAGRVTREKNVHSILEAVHELSLLGYPVKLVMVGRIEDAPFVEFYMFPTDLEDKIENLIDSLQISENVVMPDWQSSEKLNELYNAADAFINLTLHHDENFGLSQIEAMSAELPVIGTAWGGLKDTIVKEVGFSIDTWVTTHGVRFDAPAVMKAIKCLIENRQLCKKKGQHGRKRAIAHYSESLYRENVKQLIETVINRPINETTGTLTPFGHQFNQRFIRKDIPLKYAKSPVAGFPIYDGLSDADYRQLITPYTSRFESTLKTDSSLFQALSGKTNGDFFISEDLLYSIRIPISSEEANIINKLNRWKSLRRDSLHHSDDILIELIRKGIIGISDLQDLHKSETHLGRNQSFLRSADVIQ